MEHFKLAILVITVFIGITHGPVHVSCQFPPGFGGFPGFPPPGFPPPGFPPPGPIDDDDGGDEILVVQDDGGFDGGGGFGGGMMGGLGGGLGALLALPLICKY